MSGKRLPPISALDELAATASAVLREGGLGAALSDSYAREIAGAYARAIGGRAVYIPAKLGRLPRAVLATRDAEIRAAFNGRNGPVLARRHGLTVRRIMQIVRTPSNVLALRRRA